MPRNTFSLPLTETTEQTLTQWFEANGYDEVEHTDGEWCVTHPSPISKYMTQGAIFHSIKENPGYRTFVKTSDGNSLLVFEIKLTDTLLCECYSPIMLFGFFRKEMEFKENSGFITSYLKKGHADMVAFKETLIGVEDKL